MGLLCERRCSAVLIWEAVQMVSQWPFVVSRALGYNRNDVSKRSSR
jgi:hypothetical protein